MDKVRYGMLTAVRPTEEEKNGERVWEWECDCGGKVYRTMAAVKRMNLPNCGCTVKSRFDVKGKRFGMLTAVRPTKERKYTNVVWEWECDCGGKVYKTVNEVRQLKERNQNCGCTKSI